jgi:hypothetical protein
LPQKFETLLELALVTGGIYDACRWVGLRLHDILAKIHDDRYRHWSVVKLITLTIWDL